MIGKKPILDKKDKIKRIIGYVGIAVLVANLILYSLKVIGEMVFWGIIIVMAIIAFKVMSFLNKKAS